jgi:cysteate synthase
VTFEADMGEENMVHNKLTLRCVACGATYAPHRLHCDHCDGLLRSHYRAAAFEPLDCPGASAFCDWLPSGAAFDTAVGTAIYPSRGLGKRLGLDRLAIAFSGYAPQIGARNPTGSFKDLEAMPTLLYTREHGVEPLILASAGNTARAFAYAAVQLRYPVVIVVPERAWQQLWLPCPPTDAVQLIVLEGCDDYAAAIRTAGWMGQVLGIANEGGVRNVARRDGMSTVILEYARQMGSLPAHYFQAVGSGTGGIAAWEASERLLAAGIGDGLPKLHLSQNAPFTPIHDAWTFGRPIEPHRDVEGQLTRIAKIDAPVLANRTPPYDMPGGVRDALSTTRGHTYAVSNKEARAAARLFEEAEGPAIGSAAAVATASLLQAVAARRLAARDPILLHITGNGDLILRKDVSLHHIKPAWMVRLEDITEDTIREHLAPRPAEGPAAE